MTIKKLQLQNFRSHANSTVDFAPQLTALLGPTGAGKTSVLNAIAYTLAGACQFTSKDGKLAQHLINVTAEDQQFVTTVETDAFTVTKTRKARSVLPSMAQAVILDRLGVSSDVLLALLDATPLLTRSPADQHAILCRLLPPPEIKLGRKATAAGVPPPVGIEHLDKLVKEMKEGKLRDLRREVRDYRPEAPVWPLEGYTEADIEENFKGVMRERDKLLGDKALLDALIAQDDATLAVPEQPAATEEDRAKAEALRAEVKVKSARLADWEVDSKPRLEAIRLMKAEVAAKQSRAAELVSQNFQANEGSTKHPNCPTCTCPLPDFLVDGGHVKAELADLSRGATQLEATIAAHEETQRHADAAITKVREEIRQAELDIRSLETVEKQAKKTREPRDVTARRNADSKERLSQCTALIAAQDERLAKGKTYRDQIAKYNADLAAAREDLRRWTDLTRELIPQTEGVIDEMEALREKLLQDHVGAFLADMQKILDTFQMAGLAYDLEQGFFFAKLDANYLSTGQAQMLFEVAFRIAAAGRTGLKLVLLDHVAPVDDEHAARIMEALLGCGHQVIMTWTLSEKPTSPRKPGVLRYWCESTPAGTLLSVV